MNYEEAALIIKWECVESDGFLVKLHAFREFDEERFTTLVRAIEIFNTEVCYQTDINRMLAGYLYELSLQLFVKLQSFPRNDEEVKLINNACAQVSDLVSQTFFHTCRPPTK